MINVISALLLLSGGGAFKAHDLFFATETRLTQIVGKRVSPPKEPGIRFAHPGYYEVWVDAPGSGMKHVRLGLGSLLSWKTYLSQLGLGATHAKVHSLPVASSPIPLYRNKLA